MIAWNQTGETNKVKALEQKSRTSVLVEKANTFASSHAPHSNGVVAAGRKQIKAKSTIND